jgi:hypothetical protein
MHKEGTYMLNADVNKWDSVSELGKQAAIRQFADLAEKQASKFSLATRAFNYAAPTAKKFVSGFFKPTPKPNPTYVANAAPMPTSKPANMATRALNYVSNVPKGERFAQRPVANTVGLFSMDGVPGMRRAGQGVMLGTGLYGANQARNFNNELNQHIDTVTSGVSNVLGLKPESYPKVNQQLHGLKWDFAKDLTLGSANRYMRGNSNVRQQLHDKVVRDNLWDAAGHALRYPTEETSTLAPVYTFLKNRNIPAAVSNQVASATNRIVPPPRSPLAAARDSLRGLSQAGLSGAETSYETMLRNRFPQVNWDDITPQRKAQLLSILIGGAGSAGARVYAGMQQ